MITDSHDAREETFAHECTYGKMWYNVTKFTVNNVDTDKQLICAVRFTAVGNSSVVFSGEQFVVFHGWNKASEHDRVTSETRDNNVGM